MIETQVSDDLLIGLFEDNQSGFSYTESQQLNEKIYSIDSKDINRILPSLSIFEKGLTSPSNPDAVNLWSFPYTQLGIIDSSIFSSPECKKAHEKRPVTVRVFNMCHARYLPESSIIDIGYPYFINIILQQWTQMFNTLPRGTGITSIIDIIAQRKSINPTQTAYIKRSITHTSLLTTFYHELSHWISDTLYNDFITNAGKRAASSNRSMSKYHKVPDMIFSALELDAYMNGLSYLKSVMGQEEWDTLTFEDLFDRYPALQAIKQSEHASSISQFKRQLFSRLRRDRMLGKNMEGA